MKPGTTPSSGAAVVDLAFEVSGGALPREHSLELWNALRIAEPALADDEWLAILPLRAAETGSGTLLLQRRSRLLLRAAEFTVEALLGLCGRTIEVCGAAVTLGAAKTRPLAPHATLYAQRVAAELDDESQFVGQALRDLAALGVRTDFIVGRRSSTAGPAGALAGFSLMLTELTPRESLALQAHGMGSHRRLGFGIFLGHR